MKEKKEFLKCLNLIKKFKSLNINKVFPGHYENFENAIEVIDKQVDRINMRKEECFQLIKNGTDNFMEIGRVMYRQGLPLAAMSMIVGYLDLLEAEGRIFYGEENGEGVKIYAK